MLSLQKGLPRLWLAYGQLRMFSVYLPSQNGVQMSSSPPKLEEKDIKQTKRVRLTEWNLPDLDKLPGGFRGKVYNKRNWTDFLSKNTKILEKSDDNKGSSGASLKPPPKGWRNDKTLPEWKRQKYALREKQINTDTSKVKKVSRATMDFIRKIHAERPELTTAKLAELFKVSPLAISKILKSKWTPDEKVARKKDEKFAEHSSASFKERLVERKLEEFFENKEQELGMEIPHFLKQKLRDDFKLYGAQSLDPYFNQLNEARQKLNEMMWEQRPGNN